MCFTLKSAATKYLTTAFIALSLSGCGSIESRLGKKESDIYLGSSTNIKAATNPYVVIYTLGLGSLMVLATLPADIAIDTALLPVDMAILYKRNRAWDAYKNSLYKIPVIGINLINTNMQISYIIKYPTIKYPTAKDSDISIITTGKLSSTIGPLHKNNRSSYNLDFAKNATEKNSFSIEWRLSEPYKYNPHGLTDGEELKPKHAYSVNEEFPLPDLNQDHSALVVIFMPCYQTMIVPISNLQSAEELIKMPEIQQRYQELLQQDKKKRCVMPPSFSQVPFK